MVAWMQKRNQVVDGKLTYQYHKLEAALGYVKEFRTAVDVGGHCGLWSMHLAKRFVTVHAFEPVALHRECFNRNVVGENVWLHACALGERSGLVNIHTSHTSSGDSWVDGEGDIPLKTLDSYKLRGVSFIKLDCEGFELFALRGGIETLEHCHPVVCVEQKPGRAQKYDLPQTAAVDFLIGLGAKLRREIGGDYILSWDD